MEARGEGCRRRACVTEMGTDVGARLMGSGAYVRAHLTWRGGCRRVSSTRAASTGAPGPVGDVDRSSGGVTGR
jgi:hypothetical protein